MKRGRISEKAVFETTDGRHFENLQEAQAHQEAVDFKNWCDENICYTWSARMVADAILEHWDVTPKEKP